MKLIALYLSQYDSTWSEVYRSAEEDNETPYLVTILKTPNISWRR